MQREKNLKTICSVHKWSGLKPAAKFVMYHRATYSQEYVKVAVTPPSDWKDSLSGQQRPQTKHPPSGNMHWPFASAVRKKFQAAPVNPEHTDGKTSHPFDGDLVRTWSLAHNGLKHKSCRPHGR